MSCRTSSASPRRRSSLPSSSWRRRTMRRSARRICWPSTKRSSRTCLSSNTWSTSCERSARNRAGIPPFLYLVLATMCLVTGAVIKFRSILSLAGAVSCSIKRASLRVFCGASGPAPWLKEQLEESPEYMISLKELLEDKEVPNLVIKVIVEVVSHLQQLHSRGEISDIVAPPNIYVEVTEDNKVHGMQLVPKYTNNPSPEVVIGHSTSPASDMYALGQLIGHCFKENKSSLMLPASLLRLHQKAMSKGPKRRPSASAPRKFVADALRYWRNPRRGM